VRQEVALYIVKPYNQITMMRKQET